MKHPWCQYKSSFGLCSKIPPKTEHLYQQVILERKIKTLLIPNKRNLINKYKPNPFPAGFVNKIVKSASGDDVKPSAVPELSSSSSSVLETSPLSTLTSPSTESSSTSSA